MPPLQRPAPSAAVAAPLAYAFGEFRIEAASRTLCCGDQVVHLPSRAFDALLYLVEHRHRLVPKDELVSAVWQNVVVTDDSLVHAISVVRRALADDPSEPRYIQTIPRRGYRFIGEARVIVANDAPQHGAHVPVANGAPAEAPNVAGSTDVRSRTRRLLAPTAVAAIIAASAMLALPQRPPTEPERRTVTLFQPPPPGSNIVSGGALSPDGRHLALSLAMTRTARRHCGCER